MAEDTTYTQEELDAKVAEANKAIERSRNEALADKRKAREEAETLRGQLEEMQGRLQELEQKAHASKAGVDDDTLAELRAKLEADLQRKWSKVAEERDAAVKARDEALAANRTMQLDNEVKTIIGKGGALPHRVNELFRLKRDLFDLSDDGEPILREDPGTPLDKWVSESLSAEYPEWFEGTGSSGGGASRSAAGGSGTARVIAAGDNSAFIANLESIAKGETKVNMPG